MDYWACLKCIQGNLNMYDKAKIREKYIETFYLWVEKYYFAEKKDSNNLKNCIS